MSEIAATTTSRIEGSIDMSIAGKIPVSFKDGIGLAQMEQAMQYAKILAIANQAVPKHCRDNPGMCLAICLNALAWEMDPFAIANKSYVVNDRLAYEAQLYLAVVRRRANLQGRLRFRYEGEGQNRRCIVWGTFEGETEPSEFVSSKFGDIQPKNSPLWKTKPDLQLFYNAARDWARVHCADILLGVYSRDEMEDTDPADFPANGRPVVSMPQAIVNGTVVNADKPAVEVERKVEQPVEQTKPAAKKKTAKANTPEPVKEEAKTVETTPTLAEGEVADDNSWDEPPTDDGPPKKELFDDGGASAQKL